MPDSGKVLTGPELIEQIGKHPNLDTVLDRDPHAKPLTDQELEHLVVRLRQDRATIETKREISRQKRKDKANGND